MVRRGLFCSITLTALLTAACGSSESPEQADAAGGAADAGVPSADAMVPAPDAMVPNQPPVVTADNASTDEDSAIIIDVLANDVDKDPATLTVTGVDTTGTLGAVSVEVDNTISYDPSGAFEGFGEGETGTDTFQYTIQDVDGAVNTGTVTVTITGVNDAPTVDALVVATQQTSVDVVLVAADVDDGTVTFAIDTPPTQGSLGAITPIDGHTALVTYTPDPGAIGGDSFTYTASDSLVTSAPATADISISGTPIALTMAHVFDTDTGELDGIAHPGWDGAALNVGAIDIPAGTSLLVVGSQPFIVNSDGDVSVAGTIDLAGEAGGDSGAGCNNVAGGAGGLGGPGGFDGGAGGGASPGTDSEDGASGFGPGAGGGAVSNGSSNGSAGGGGAGHAVDGVAGSTNISTVPIPGAAGTQYASLPPLLGGSGGGGGSVEKDGAGGTLLSGDDDGSGGGGGGGAIRMVAAGVLTVDGLIDASGGSGGVNDCAGGDGGGGAGGAIELLAPAMPAVAGVLDITGGSAGTTGGTGSDGRVLVGVAP